MPTSLVTGGAGFLGSHLCDYLLARGHRVVCVDNLETGSLRNIAHVRGPDFAFLQADITSRFEVDGPVDLVFHMASPASPIDYARLPLHTLKVGAYGTHNALGLAKAKRARFLLASTSEVYGDPLVHPQPESYWGNVNPIGPRGVYDEAKRYAEALSMAYLRQQGVDTCIARIFNSILADEQVLYDDGRELRREPVEALAARVAPRALAAGYVARSASTLEPDPATEYSLDGYRVPAFEGAGSMVAAPVAALVAHPPSGPCYEVRTRYGRSIRVTGDHSIFVEGAGGRPEPRAVEDLEVGDRVAIARRIEVPERDRGSVSMLDVWRHAEGDPWDLSVEAPGLGALAWAKRQELFGLLVSERRNAGPHWRNGAWTKLMRMRDSDRLPLPVLRRVVEELPAGARVRTRRGGCSLPAAVTVTDELLWLLGLWVAVGDPVLGRRAEGVARRTFGPDVFRPASSSGGSPPHLKRLKLLVLLMDFLGFDHEPTRIPGWILGLPLRRLGHFLEGFREGACRTDDTYDVREEGVKDDLIVAFARFGLLPAIEGEGHSWRLTLCDVRPWSPLAWHAGVEQRLNARVTGDLVWATVEERREIATTPLVYDFSVPGLENFWAGSGVLAHNTFGPRMRPNDGRAIPTFLQQSLRDRPLTVFGDGSQTRSFCYVDDLIRGLVALAESGLHEPVNLGNPAEMTLLEMAQLVIELTESRSEIVFEALPVDDPKVRQPDISRARELLEWEPRVELRDGLQTTIDDMVRVLGEPV